MLLKTDIIKHVFREVFVFLKASWKAKRLPVSRLLAQTSSDDFGLFSMARNGGADPRPAARCERLSPLIKECSRCRVKVLMGVVAGRRVGWEW